LLLDIIKFVEKLGTCGQPVLMGENELKLLQDNLLGQIILI